MYSCLTKAIVKLILVLPCSYWLRKYGRGNQRQRTYKESLLWVSAGRGTGAAKIEPLARKSVGCMLAP